MKLAVTALVFLMSSSAFASDCNQLFAKNTINLFDSVVLRPRIQESTLDLGGLEKGDLFGFKNHSGRMEVYALKGIERFGDKFQIPQLEFYGAKDGEVQTLVLEGDMLRDMKLYKITKTGREASRALTLKRQVQENRVDAELLAEIANTAQARAKSVETIAQSGSIKIDRLKRGDLIEIDLVSRDMNGEYFTEPVRVRFDHFYFENLSDARLSKSTRRFILAYKKDNGEVASIGLDRIYRGKLRLISE